ncbi:MAG TPA: archaeoflavoprotein AfpA [Patescibacteria group bacterium]|nr:archaeoflavoprotein AfpA [Patescibacteria group bacterium]
MKGSIAWGITGSGDKLEETVDAMSAVKSAYGEIQIDVYLSKAGEQVVKYYGLEGGLEAFDKVYHEKDANNPFLAGKLQTGRYDLLLVAPSTSNTVAKLVAGIADTMLTNAAIQAVKAYVDVYVMPVDYREGTIVTRLPDGTEMRLRVRKEDAENVRRLSVMDGFTTFEKTEEIKGIIERHLS